MNTVKYECGFESKNADGVWKACRAKVSERQVRKAILRGWRCKKCGKRKLADFMPIGLVERTQAAAAAIESQRRRY